MKWMGLWVVVLSMSASGCLGTNSLGEGNDQTTISSPELQRELLDRWNREVDALPPSAYDFHWKEFQYFPHPTYKEGELEGYRDFGVLLLAFLERPDNFDFLASEHLFDGTLYYEILPERDEWTFRILVDQFSADDSFGVDESTRARLKQMAIRIDETD